MATSEGDFLEHIIHHIQSFMSGKEAARTTLLSKSWYKAWLTRHALHFSTIDFKCTPTQFSKFMIETLHRYQDMDLNIHSFRLHLRYRLPDRFLLRSLVATAIKFGANDLDLDLKELMLPAEVLASETLVRLSLKSCEINRNYLVRCSKLKSLSLERIRLAGDDVLLLRNIISCCVSIEELSLSICHGLTLRRMDMLELRKLRRLSLYSVDVDQVFFNDFGSRFPTLKYLNLKCRFNGRVVIASPSLEHVCLWCGHSIAMFDVPNIRSFSYSVSNLESSLSIKESASTDWEFEISVTSFRLLQEASYSRSYLIKLKEMFAEFGRRSRMSLCVSMRVPHDGGMQDEDVRVGLEGVVLENLTVEDATSSFALLARLFRICRPKFLTTYGRTARDIFKQRNLFVEIGLIKVEITELYEQFRAGWRPLVLKESLEAGMSSVKSPKVRFQLTWEQHTG